MFLQLHVRDSCFPACVHDTDSYFKRVGKANSTPPDNLELSEAFWFLRKLKKNINYRFLIVG
jgi:hypothetical protein